MAASRSIICFFYQVCHQYQKFVKMHKHNLVLVKIFILYFIM